jgi:hypothetical protein
VLPNDDYLKYGNRYSMVFCNFFHIFLILGKRTTHKARAVSSKTFRWNAILWIRFMR